MRFAILLLALLPLFAGCASAPEPTGGPFSIMFDVSMGRAGRSAPEPMLVLHPDGRAVAGAPYGGPSGERLLTPDEVSELRQWIVQTNRVFSINARHVNGLAHRVRRGGRHLSIADGGSVRLAVTDADRTAEFQVYAPSFAAKHFPNDTQLMRFLAITDRLRALRNEIIDPSPQPPSEPRPSGSGPS